MSNGKPNQKKELIDKIQQEIIETLEKKSSAAGAGKVSAFFNQEEEAKDVQKFAPAANPAAAAAPVTPLDYSKMAEQLVSASGVILKDPILSNRLKNLVASQLRGVRKLLDTRLILIRPAQLGGLGFDGTRADQIIEVISKKLDQLGLQEKKLKIVDEKVLGEFSKIKSSFVEPEARPIAPPTAPMPARQPLVQPPVQSVVQPPKQRPPTPSPTVPQPSVQQPTLAQPRIAQPAPRPVAPPKPEVIKPEKPEFEIPVKDFSQQISAAVRPLEPGKITDIKIPFQLVGPVQELKYSLIDFRRLADSPSRAAQKILEKLKNLEAESFSQRISGIQAWQTSEVFQIYLGMGLESLVTKVLIDDIIKKRQTSNQVVLTQDEFQAVNLFNQSIQF